MNDDECQFNPDDHSEADIDRHITGHFLELFADPQFCTSIAPQVTCPEAEIIELMIVIHGGPEAARTWLECHSDGDGPEDAHHIPEIPDHPPLS